jgi:hypothetical protein
LDEALPHLDETVRHGLSPLDYDSSMVFRTRAHVLTRLGNGSCSTLDQVTRTVPDKTWLACCDTTLVMLMPCVSTWNCRFFCT